MIANRIAPAIAVLGFFLWVVASPVHGAQVPQDRGAPATNVTAMHSEMAPAPLPDPQPDSLPALRIHAFVQEALDEGVLGERVVMGEGADAAGLILDLTLQLLAAVGSESFDPESGPEATPAVEARTLYTLGQAFESRGYLDLAADAYQMAMDRDPALDEARDAWRQLVGRWELNVFIGSLNDEPELAVPQDPDVYRRDALIGVRVAHHFPSGLLLEGEVSNSLAGVGSGVGRQNLNAWPVFASVGWDVPVTHDFELAPMLGIGAMVWRPSGGPGSTDLALNAGATGRLFVSRNVGLRADVRLHYVPDALGPTLAELGFSDPVDFWGLGLSAGVSWFPGGR